MDTLTHLTVAASPAWAVAAGLAVTLGLLVVGRRLGPRRPTTDLIDAPGPSAPTSAGARRSALRRPGQPIPVEVLGPGDGERQDGQVLDRSRTGLRLAVRREIPTRARLQVRACHAPDGSPMVGLKVRWCKQAAGRWELGCEFTEDQPWSVLLLFG